MLFRDVDGPQLDRIFGAIAAQGSWLEPDVPSVRETLAFLSAARLIEERDGKWMAVPSEDESFPLRLLRALRCLELGAIPAEHEIDRYYLGLIARLFIKPNRMTVTDLYAAANELLEWNGMGHLVRDQVASWGRVMEYFQIGTTTGTLGFSCAYSPQLIASILHQWNQREGRLGEFFETTFSIYLPYQTADGALARTVCAMLDDLVEEGIIELEPTPRLGLVGYAEPFSLVLRRIGS